MVYRLVSDFLLVHLFTGPKPRDVLAQLTAYIGRMPKTPAKFALGYTLCRETSEDGMPSVQHDYARLTEDLEASDHENFTNFTQIVHCKCETVTTLVFSRESVPAIL